MIPTAFIYILAFILTAINALPNWSAWPAGIHAYFIKTGQWLAWLDPWWDLSTMWLCVLTLTGFLIVWLPFKIIQRVFRIKILTE